MQIKLLRGAKMPEYKTDGAAGMDLAFVPLSQSAEAVRISPGETDRVPLGVAISIPQGYEGQLRPRSSMSAGGLLIHTGTVDSDYRGEIWAIVTNVGRGVVDIEKGARICQLIIAPVARASIEVVEELSETARGEGGFGSTGK